MRSLKFPIRAKLLLLISGAVLAATGAYLTLALKLFRDDKTQLVYEFNASSVKTLAAEVDATIEKFADKVRLLTMGHQNAEWARAIFEAEPDLVAYSLYELSNEASQWKLVSTVRNKEYLKLYGLGADAVDRARSVVPVPFETILAKGSLAYNSTVPEGAPIMSLGMTVQTPNRQVPLIAVVDIRLDQIQKLVTESGIATRYVVDAEGKVLAHPDAAWVSGRVPLGEVAIVREAVDSNLAFQLKTFEWRGQKWLGAYSMVGFGGLRVISQVEEAQAFRAARKLIEKSVLFALIVITAAILLATWLARTFTEPLQRLLTATEKLSRWEFTDSVHVRSRDEIAALARAFNSMANDLQRQRREIESHQKELELKVKERTAALEAERQQAAQAQDALVRTTRLASLGELAGIAAHEILNPLNNMNIRIERSKGAAAQAEANDLKLLAEIVEGWGKSYAQGGWDALGQELNREVSAGKKLVDEDLENLKGISDEELKRLEERRQDYDFLGKEINRVTRIINNMRALSRVGGERKPLDIHLPIDDTAVTLGDQLAKRNVSLVKEYGAETREHFTVVADRDELVQVFSNLVRNAMHAIDSAKRRAGEIKISTRCSERGVEVRISDNGTGIEADHLPRLFEPNFTTKGVEQGTGLGLSISRRLVRAFGGDLELEKSVVGEGTTFLIWFPAGDALASNSENHGSI